MKKDNQQRRIDCSPKNLVNGEGDIETFKEEQKKWQSQIVLTPNFDLTEIKIVAGVDLAYWSEEGADFGVCSIILINYVTKEVIERVSVADRITVPYHPGYLAFRELPLILKAAVCLKHQPDIYMFDGNGFLHPLNMGIATHASFYLDKPTIGVAKTFFNLKGIEFVMPANKIGGYTLIEADGLVYGASLRTRENVKPVFVSCGNWIDLETALAITMGLVTKDSRLPMTTRLADLETHKQRKLLKNTP